MFWTVFMVVTILTAGLVVVAVIWSFTRVQQTQISADSMTQQARAQRTIFHKSDAQDAADEQMVTISEMHDEVNRVLREHGLTPDDDREADG